MCDEDIKVQDKCQLCNKILTNGGTCSDHDEKVKQYECLFCDLHFSRQASLVWHLKTAHDYKLDTNPRKSYPVNDHNYYERPKCSKCNVELLNAYELEKHACASSEPVTPKLEQSTQGNKLVESSVNKIKNDSSVTQPNKVKKLVESPARQPSKVKKLVKEPNRVMRESIIEPNKVKKESAITEPNKAEKVVESPVTQPNKLKEAIESPVTQPNKVKEAIESPVTHASKGRKSDKSEANKAKKARESSVIHCSNCNKDFASQDEYHKHISKYATKYRPFFCCICQTTFSRKRSLIFHLYIHKRSSEPESKVSSLSDIAAPPRAFPYTPAPKKTPVKKEVETSTPARKSTRKESDTEGPARKSARISTETKKKPDKPVPRDEPQFIDVRSNNLGNQKCLRCQRKFKKVLDLESHMIDEHKAPLMHKCSLCLKAFVLKSSLVSHAITHIF